MVLARTVADGCERLRTVANGWDRERNVERTHPQPPDPQSETGTLATHSGKTSISCEASSNIDIFHTLSNRLECHKVPRLPRKTTGQPAWKHSKRTCFPASPIDTATPQENQRLETRHMGAKKRAFRARLLPISNIDIFHTLSNRLECHKVPRLPRKTTGQPAWKHSKRTCFPASPIDTATPQENQRLERRHVDAEKRAFRRRLPPILTFLTHYQTGWNVTKRHACHAKRHDNFLGNLRKGEVLRLPP